MVERGSFGKGEVEQWCCDTTQSYGSIQIQRSPIDLIESLMLNERNAPRFDEL